ncbi:MAG: HD domain-containing protein [bacterium]|nr:HD domain-containing protein [bacterium]
MDADISNLLVEASGFSRDSGLTVFLVGGAVRDLALDRESRDLDFLALEPGGAKILAGFFHRKMGFHRPVLFAAGRNQAGKGMVKTGRTCTACPERSRRIDTYQTARGNLTLNIVSSRGKDLEEDLRFRDFTINTLIIPLSKLAGLKLKGQSSCLRQGFGRQAKFKVKNSKPETPWPTRAVGSGRRNPKQETRNLIRLIEDPLGTGKKDLARELIRTPINPALTIADDPLRMLRAVRIARELDFSLAPELKREIRKSRTKISSVSAERVRDELGRMILLPRPSRGVLLLENLKLLGEIVPELQATVDFDQKSPYHHEDLFHHSLSTLDRTRADLALRLAALFHDLGKVAAQRLISKDVQGDRDYYVYWGHQDGSAEMAKKILLRLRFPKKLRDEVRFLVQHHMVNYQADWKDATIRRLAYRLGPHLQKTLELLKADSASLKPPFQKDKGFEEMAGRIARIKLEEGQKVECPLDGFEIQKILGIEPGPEVGKAKQMVVEAILDGKIAANRREAKRYLLKTISSPRMK